jgi:hypothetical protein
MIRFYPFLFSFFLLFQIGKAQPGTISLRGNTYYLGFSDEFNGARVDSTRWDFRRDSKALSTQLPANSTLKNGVLNVALKKETVSGKNYTGGGLISEDTLHYGYYEATLKTPPGAGWHSGFWLMKQDGTGGTGVSKATLEIDILENESGNLNSFTCLHRKYNPVANLGIKVYNTAALNSAFIKVGCLYEADSITFYYNNLQVDKRFVGNLITGKVNIWLTCIGYTAPIDDSQVPNSFQVDYIRYYQKTPPVKNSITLGPVIDAVVKNGGQASTNFGSSTALNSLSNGSGSISESLLRFDLSTVKYTIGSAKLRVYGAINGGTPGDAIVKATGLNPFGTWTENGVNWNNKPAESGGKITSQTVSGTTQKYYEWDVTSYIIAQKELAMRNLVNLKLSQDAGTNALVDFLSREAAGNRPQLVITPIELVPVIITNPKDTLVTINNNASFSVVANGLNPLFYQWKKDGVAIPGATSSTYNIANVLQTDTGFYTVEVGYGPGFGVAETNVAKLSVLLINQKPTAIISTPTISTNYAMGQSISFSGSGTDPETGSLLSPDLLWSVQYFRNGLQVSSVNLPSGFSGTYLIPTTAEANNNVFYRFTLIARDPQGERDTIFRDIQPRLRTLSLATSPSGYNINLDGSVLTTPSSSFLIEGSVHTLDFPTPQSSNYFKYWSQGGTKAQNFTIPGSNPSLVAYLASGSPTILNPNHDAYINAGGSANANFGSATTMIVKVNADPNTTRESLLRFNLSSVIGAPLESRLRLYGGLSDNSNPSVILQVREVSTSNVWNEGTITWNTKPLILPTVLATQTFAGTTKQYYDFDLSAFIISSIAAGKTSVEFSISSPVSTASRVDINSKESGSFPPELVVVTSTSSVVNITTQPTSQSICEGQPVTFVSAATASPSPSVQWQRSSDNGTTWTDISGAINPGYTFNTVIGNNGNQFRARWFISGDTNSSNPAILTVNPDIAVPVITSPATYICPASSLVLTSSYPTGNVWSSGQLTSSISVSTAGSYSVTVTSNGCVKTSAPVVITLNTAIANNSISTTAPGCFGATPLINGSLPTGGNGTYNYQWESSIVSGSSGFTSIQTAFSQSITADPVLTPTWFRRTVSSGNCAGSFSNVLAIAADLPVLNNDISAPQTVCSNTPAAQLLGSTPTGGTGVYAYLWESATTLAGPYTTAGGTNNQINYSPGTITANRWFRRRVISGSCGISFSDTVAITVIQAIANNTISTVTTTICSGNSPLISGTLPTFGTGAYSYSWEVSTTSSSAGFAAIPTSDVQNLTTATVSQNSWFRRVVTSGACSSISNVIGFTINLPILSNDITGNQTVCSNISSATLTGPTPTGGTGGYSYTWESSTSLAGPYTTASGTNNQINYSPGTLPTSRWFRRRVTAGVCPAFFSDTVAVTVNPVIANNTISGIQTICTGSTPSTLTGSVPTGGNGSYSYIWQISTIGSGSGFTDIPSSDVQNYSHGPLTQTTWFRRIVVSPPCANNVSSAIQITIQNNIGNNIVSAAQIRCSGVAPSGLTGTSPSNGSGSYTYVWQSSTTDALSGFAPIVPAATGSNYNPPALTTTTWYRRVVSSAPCAANISDAIQITVQQPIANNVVTPSTQTICTGTAPATFTGSLPTNGNGVYTYSWEVSSNSALSGFSGISSSNVQDYTSGNLTGNRWFKRVVTSGPCANSISTVVAVIINPTIGNNTISAAQTICSGSSPATLTGSNPNGGGGSGTYTYQWESSTTSAGAGFTPISLATAAGYAPGPLNQTTWFRRIVSSPPCADNVSAAIQITVQQPIANNDASDNQIVCSNISAATLIGSIPTGGSGTYSYLWESAITLGGAFTNAIGTNNQVNYSPGTLGSNRWFRRRVISGPCPVTYSDTIFISVVPQITNIIIGSNQTICNGSTPSPFFGNVLSGGTGIYSYSWEVSTTSSSAGFTAIPSTNSPGYTSGPLTQNSWFRRVITSGVCSASATLAVTINQPITNNDIESSQTICAGTAPATFIGSVASGGNGTSYAYQWQFASSALGPFSSAGVISTNYTAPVPPANRWYRRMVTSGVCPVSFSDTIAVTRIPAISNNVLVTPVRVCTGSAAPVIKGGIPTGASGVFTYAWESSTTSASSGFSLIPGETGDTLLPGILPTTTWFRRIVYSSVCTNISVSVPVFIDFVPTVSAGPAMADIVQGGFSGILGGSFGGGATAAIWSAPEGVFFNNSGTTPGTATYQASNISAPIIPLTITVDGGGCGLITDTKNINVIPDPFGITGVINEYGQVILPVNIPVGSLKCTLASGQASDFAINDRVMLIQMKGASVSLPSSPTDVTYGYLTGLGNAGNHEFLKIEAISGDEITFERCTKKSYTNWGAVQLVKIPQYTGNYNVKSSTAVSAIRLTRKGMGYLPNSVLTTGFSITPVQGGAGLSLQAYTDALGQISEVAILNAGAGYLKPPIITFPDPTEAPFNLPAYKAKALAVMGLTAKQWNGKRGGILAFEVAGNLTLLDSIHMTGMGFAGGMIGDKGDPSMMPSCGTPEYGLNFSNVSRAGQKGESIANIPVTALRGKGRYGTGGGGGVEPEGGGGGGANWQDGGRGGSSSYVVIPNSACSTSITPCDRDALRGGLGGGTNPTVPATFKNVLRSSSYFYTPDLCRFFLGGGGGGGHALNATVGEQFGGAGGFGGGIVFLKGQNLTSNNYEIFANGEKGENAYADGAGGGGAGGAIILDFQAFTDNVNGRINGGNGGNALRLICEQGDSSAFPTRYRYHGAGGGGGGGVIWFSQDDLDVTPLAAFSNIGQSNQGANGDNLGNTAAKGGSSRSQSEFNIIENAPYVGSVFTVGGTTPKPTFTSLETAAAWLSYKGTDATEVTLLVTENTSNPSFYNRYIKPATFTRIFTPGCTYGDATLIIKPRTTINSVNLMNEVDDNAYITLDGIPKVTIKDLKISAGVDENINTLINVKNGSELFLDNVDANADIVATSIGTNKITLKKVKNTGSINIGANQILDITDSLTLVGSNTYSRSLTFGSGSTFNMPAGTKLNLQGVSWTNNGLANMNIDPSAKLNLTGSFGLQTIGGTSVTNFDVLNVSNTGPISITSNIGVKRWLQTSNSTVNTTNRIVTISEKITTGPGSFTGTGAGRIRLNNGSIPVDVQGKFFNLEVNSAGNANVTAPISIDGNLILSNGRLDVGIHSVTVESNLSNSITYSPTSWVNGPLKRKVETGNAYFFPVGDANKQENVLINFNSISGGLQYLTSRFQTSDPNVHPVVSTVTPFQDGLNYFSSLAPEGYWSINPDAGSANYDVWIFPSFAGSYFQNSIFKRSTGGNEWAGFGSFSNPENTSSNIQSDGSVRRLGLTGFSDFGLAGGEAPLPLDFISFNATRKRNGIQLDWKMAECLKAGKFVIKKGLNSSNLSSAHELKVQSEDCKTDFQLIDDKINSGVPRYFYQIEASAEGEKTLNSAIKAVNLGKTDKEKPFISVIQNESKQFRIMDENVETSGINIVTVEGKTIAENISAKDQILDLSTVPNGVYLVELKNNGWTVRQKIVVGY